MTATMTAVTMVVGGDVGGNGDVFVFEGICVMLSEDVSRQQVRFHRCRNDIQNICEHATGAKMLCTDCACIISSRPTLTMHSPLHGMAFVHVGGTVLRWSLQTTWQSFYSHLQTYACQLDTLRPGGYQTKEYPDGPRAMQRDA